MNSVDCPVCGKQVKFHLLNSHLDSNCKAFTAASFKVQNTLDTFATFNTAKHLSTFNPHRFFSLHCPKYNNCFNAKFHRHKPASHSILFEFNGFSSKFYLCAPSEITSIFNVVAPVSSASTTESKSETLTNILSDILQLHKSTYDIDSIPLLKSHLQKCTRRMEPHKSLITALQLMRTHSKTDLFQGILELLRRICIIPLEDSSIFSIYPTSTKTSFEYSVIVWAMMFFTRTSSLHKKQKDKEGTFKSINGISIRNLLGFILSYIHYFSSTSRYDAVSTISLDNGSSRSDKDVPFHLYNSLTIDSKSLLYSLHLRADYGGMQCLFFTFFLLFMDYMYLISLFIIGDKDLINAAALSIYERFKCIPYEIEIEKTEEVTNENETRNCETDPLLKRIHLIMETGENNFPYLRPEEWEVSASDFHVCNIAKWIHDEMETVDLRMLSETDETNGENSLESVKSMIWDFSSSVNTRISSYPHNKKDKLMNIWEKYKPLFEKKARYFISKKCPAL